MSTVYQLIEDHHSSGKGSRPSYGIAAYADPGEGGSPILLTSIHDVTSDKDALSELVRVCNTEMLSEVHLRDVIEDFLAAQ